MNPNILIFTDYEVSPNFGGIERVTEILATALIKDNYLVYNAFVNKVPNNYRLTDFTGSFHVDIKNISSLVDYVTKKKIDIVLVQNSFKNFKYIISAIKESERSIKLIFAHHQLPESEYSFLKFHQYKKTLFTDKRLYVRDIMRLSKWIINYHIVKYRWIKNYRNVYKESDFIVLLSGEYIEQWKYFAKLKSISKCIIIPNPRSFDKLFQIQDYETFKQHDDASGNLLIVSRLEEQQKRISTALNMYKILSEQYPKWHLYIVGDGPDRQSYQNFVNNSNLKNVHFEGTQDPIKYYLNSSIFIMTSAREAFPLTLIEAQQMGCVPLAFDTFGAVNTIIKNGETGYIIPVGEIDKYITRIKLLIEDSQLRRNMASKGIEYSKNFSIEKIIEMWINLFNN